MSGQNNVVDEIVDSRVSVYGDPVQTFARIAEVWSGILGVPVSAHQVPLCLIGLKLVRTTETPDYSDNSDDVEGYLDIFRKIIGPDMVHARSVREYLERKYAREVAQDLDRQNRFYAENDPSIPARPAPDEEG